jgi:hypothetical protein
MSSLLKTYLGTGVETHTSSYGHVNHFGNKPDPLKVFRDHPTAVIVNGSDDWNAPRERQVASLYEKAGLNPIAYFHSGISGVCKSGLVLTPGDYKKLCAYYLREFKKPLGDVLTVYRYDPKTDPRNLNNNLPCT